MNKVFLENSNTKRFQEIEPFDLVYFFLLEDLKDSPFIPEEDQKILSKLYYKTEKRTHPYFDKDSEIDIKYYVDIKKAD